MHELGWNSVNTRPYCLRQWGLFSALGTFLCKKAQNTLSKKHKNIEGEKKKWQIKM